MVYDFVNDAQKLVHLLLPNLDFNAWIGGNIRMTGKLFSKLMANFRLYIYILV